MTMDRVGFIGLGAMGKAMAENVGCFLSSPDNRAAERTLHVYNRDPQKSEAFAANAAFKSTRCTTVAELAATCNMVIMMLSNDAAVHDVVNNLLAPGASLTPGSVVVNCSTVLPETSEAVSAQLHAAGCTYLAAPVFGRPDAAAARKLLAYTSGPADTHTRAASYLLGTCRKVVHLGEQPGKANALKLSGNFMIVSVIEMLSEAMTLTDKNGISREHFMEFVSDFFPAPPIVGYCNRIANDEFEAGQGFSVDLAMKDVGHMRQLASRSQAPLPLADLAYNHLLSAQANGWGQRDWGAIAMAVRRQAGVEPEGPVVDEITS